MIIHEEENLHKDLRDVMLTRKTDFAMKGLSLFDNHLYGIMLISTVKNLLLHLPLITIRKRTLHSDHSLNTFHMSGIVPHTSFVLSFKCCNQEVDVLNQSSILPNTNFQRWWLNLLSSCSERCTICGNCVSANPYFYTQGLYSFVINLNQVE